MSEPRRIETGVGPASGSTPVFVDRLLSAAAWPLLPLLLAQGMWLRRRVPRLPEAGGPDQGRVGGGGPPIRLLVLGESTVAGVGVETHEQGLAGHLARRLAATTGRGVEWRALGRNGATARITHDELLPRLPAQPLDAVVIALGVNDVFRMHSPRHWSADLVRLVAGVRALAEPPVLLLAPVPPMDRFPAIPWPLRTVVGARARRLDGAVRRLGLGCSFAWTTPDPRQFCADGVHPSAEGYAAWGAALADEVAGRLQEIESRGPASLSPP